MNRIGMRNYRKIRLMRIFDYLFQLVEWGLFGGEKKRKFRIMVEEVGWVSTVYPKLNCF